MPYQSTNLTSSTWHLYAFKFISVGEIQTVGTVSFILQWRILKFWKFASSRGVISLLSLPCIKTQLNYLVQYRNHRTEGIGDYLIVVRTRYWFFFRLNWKYLKKNARWTWIHLSIIYVHFIIVQNAAKSPSKGGRKPSGTPGFMLFKEEQQEKIRSSPTPTGTKRKTLSVKDAKTLWEELNDVEKEVNHFCLVIILLIISDW